MTTTSNTVTVTVSATNIQYSLSLSVSPVSLSAKGGNATLTAVLSANQSNANISGQTVTFYQNNNTTYTATTDDTGTATYSVSVPSNSSSTAVGYSFYAMAMGVTSNTVTLTVVAGTPSLSITASPETVVPNQTVTFTATAVNIPAGTTVDFLNYTTGAKLTSASLSSNGTATATYSFSNSTGTYIAYEVFAQASVNGQMVSSDYVAITVAPTASISLTVSPSTISSGESVTMTADVVPSKYGYTVIFVTANGINLGTATTDSSGNASLSYTFTNTSSSAETVTIYAKTTVNGNSITSNGFAITVEGSVQTGNYGLGCTRSGFYACLTGYGSYTYQECVDLYGSKIGTACR